MKASFSGYSLLFLAICLCLIVLITQGKEIRARYPTILNHMHFPTQLSPGELSARRRNHLLSARYKNVFGNSKVVEGSAFIPNTMEAYTGKLSSSRKEVFNWQPKKNLLEYFLFR